MRKKMVLFLILILFTCSTSPGISINSQKKIPQSVAVIFSEKLKTYKVRLSYANPWFYKKGIVELDYFFAGDVLSASLFTRVNSIYRTFKMIGDEDPSARNYDRIIKFSLQRDKCGLMARGGNLDIDFEDIPDDGYRTRSSRFDIEVLIEVYDGKELELINSKSVKGSGIYRSERKVIFRPGDYHSPTMIGFEKRKNRLEKAISDAIQNVSNKVFNLLKSGFLEPKNGKDIKTRKEQTKLVLNFKFVSTDEGEEHALMLIKLAPSFESLRFGFPGDSNQYNLNEFNKHLSGYYLQREDSFNILIMNKDTGEQESIKIKKSFELKQKSLIIDISKQLKKINIIK